MNIIDPSNNHYLKIVDVTDSKNYTINISNMNNGDAVVCPFDKDMIAGKDEKGNVCIVKRRLFSFLKTFHKPKI